MGFWLVGVEDGFAFEGGADGRQGLERGFFAGADEFAGFGKIIPEEWSYVWFDDDIGFLAPFKIGVFLDNGKGTAENICKGAGLVDRARFQVNSNHKFRAEQERAFDGHERREESVDERAPFIFHGNE